MIINKVTGQKSVKMQNNGYFSWFFCYYGYQITMTTDLNIPSSKTFRVY